MNEIKVGDRVLSDLDGKEYLVTEISLRNKLCGLKGVDLIGNAVILQDVDGERHLVYEWEVSPI